MSYRFLALLPLIALTASCGDSPADAPANVATSPDLVRPKEEVSHMRLLAGRWKSQTGAIPKQDRRHLTMDISNDGSVIFALRERGPKMDIIFDEASGSLELTDQGFKGNVKNPGMSLRYFSTFHAEDPKEGILRVIGAGISIDMTYAGS